MSILTLAILVQVPSEAMDAKNEEWRNPNTGHAKRTSQGWMNKFIQLGVLVKLGKMDKAKNMLEWVKSHPIAGPSFLKHLKQFQEHGYDPDFQEY